MRIKKNKSLDLQAPKFKCDSILNPKIQEYDALNHLNRFSSNIVLGKSGQGKTSLVISFLTAKKPKIWRKVFDNIVVVMPESSRNSLQQNIFDEYLQPHNLYSSLDTQNIDEIIQKIESNANDDETTLLILDDVASALKNKYISQRLCHLNNNYRHFKCVIVYIVQVLKSVPASIRKNLTNLIMFKPSLNAFQEIMDEYLEMTKKEALQLYRLGYTENHDWLLLNTNSARIYKKFDEILMDYDG